jgi:hypothetical protein
MSVFIIIIFNDIYRRLLLLMKCVADHHMNFRLSVRSKLHLCRPMTKLCLSDIFCIYLAEFFSSNNLNQSLTKKISLNTIHKQCSCFCDIQWLNHVTKRDTIPTKVSLLQLQKEVCRVNQRSPYHRL